MIFSIFKVILITLVLFSLACKSDTVYVSDTNLKPEEIPNSEIVQHDPSVLFANIEKWQKQRIENYDFDLSASGFFRPFDPTVKVRVRNGKLVSIGSSSGKLAENPRIYEKFSTIDKLFEFLNSVSMRNPERLVVTYDAERGFPTYIDLDEKEEMADDELTLKIANFVISYGE